MTLPGHVARGVLFSLITLTWVIPAAIQDWRTGKVSNWLTLPPILVNLGLRLAGWSIVPWWESLLVIAAFLGAWHFGQMGGADVKGFIAFSLLGMQVTLAAALGMAAWTLLIRAKIVQLPRKEIPGYPGYAIGLLTTLLIYLAVAAQIVLAGT